MACAGKRSRALESSGVECRNRNRNVRTTAMVEWVAASKRIGALESSTIHSENSELAVRSTAMNPGRRNWKRNLVECSLRWRYLIALNITKTDNVCDDRAATMQLASRTKRIQWQRHPRSSYNFVPSAASCPSLCYPAICSGLVYAIEHDVAS